MAGSIDILHVDDEPEFTDLAKTFLEREDHRFAIRTAINPSEGREIIARTDLDCIISDYEMPGESGIAFLESVREAHPDLPFILFTGKGSEEVASDAISAGVTDYLQKETGREQYAILANRVRNAVTRTRAELARERMRERMELALEHTDSIAFEIDLNTGEVFRHGAFEEFFDHSPEHVPTWQDHLDSVVHPDDEEAFRSFYQAFMDGERTTGSLEYRTNAASGEVRWIKDTVAVDRPANGGGPQIVGIARDVTREKARSEELRRKERRYEAVFNDPNILVGLIDTDGTVLDINDTAMRYIEASLEDLRGQAFWETEWFDHSEEVQNDVKDWIVRAAGGEYVEFEVDLVKPNGEPYVISGVFRPVTNEAGEVVSLLISDRDITERKQHVRQLETLVENLPGVVYRCENDPGWPMKTINGRVEALTGYPRSAFEQREDLFGEEIIHPDERQRVWEAIQEALDSNDPYELTYEIITNDGKVKRVWERGQGIFTKKGELAALEGFVMEI